MKTAPSLRQNPFLITDHYNNEQFSVLGIKTLAHYYTLKYATDRGEIEHLLLLAPKHPKFDFYTNDEENNKFLMEEISQQIAQGLKELQTKLGSNPTKVMLTIAVDDIMPDHSEPLIITQKKLIALRTPYSGDGNFYPQLLQLAANKSGLQLIVPFTHTNTTSMQGDQKSCHMIAAGILKDLDRRDVEEIAKCENGYQSMAKLLKYSQSINHIANSSQSDLNLSDQIVKPSGTSLTSYVQQHKKVEESDGKKTYITRISTKSDSFAKDLYRHYMTCIARFGEDYARGFDAEQLADEAAKKVLAMRNDRRSNTEGRLTVTSGR